MKDTEQCKTCGGRQMYRCQTCGVVYVHINKYSDCGSIPAARCEGSASDPVKCPECGK